MPDKVFGTLPPGEIVDWMIIWWIIIGATISTLCLTYGIKNFFFPESGKKSN